MTRLFGSVGEVWGDVAQARDLGVAHRPHIG